MSNNNWRQSSDFLSSQHVVNDWRYTTFNIDFRAEGDYIQWRKVGSEDWYDLVALSAITGWEGWSPVFSVVSDGDRRVLKVTDWVSVNAGDSSKPDINVYVGVSGFVTDIANAIDIRGIPGATGSELITQAGHGFVPGDAVRISTSWVKAQADTEDNAEAIGIVQSVDGDDFLLVFSGNITLASGVWPESAGSGDLLFLSAATAGALTKIEPAGDYASKPMVFCYSSNTGMVVQYRAVINQDFLCDGIEFSATDKLLGRATAGAGEGEEIPCTAAARSILDDETVAAILTTLGGAGYVASSTLPTGGSIVTGRLVLLTAQDATAKAGQGLYMHDGTGWICLRCVVPYVWGNLGAAPTLALIAGCNYVFTQDQIITSGTLTLSRPGSCLFTKSGAFAFAAPTATGRTWKTRTASGWTAAAGALSEGVFTDDGTYMIASTVALA